MVPLSTSTVYSFAYKSIIFIPLNYVIWMSKIWKLLVILAGEDSSMLQALRNRQFWTCYLDKADFNCKCPYRVCCCFTVLLDTMQCIVQYQKVVHMCEHWSCFCFRSLD